MARLADDHEVQKAHHYGVAACVAGRPRVPAADQNLRDLIGAAKVGEPRTIDLMQAWDRGYSAQIDEDIRRLLTEDES